MKAPIGGGTAVTPSSGPSLSGIAVDSMNAYWASNGVAPSGMVGQTPTDGGSSVTVAPGQDFSASRSTSTSVYWTNWDGPGEVMSAPIGGGTTPTTLVSNQSHPRNIAVDSTNVYWTNDNNSAGTVMKMPIAGGTTVTSSPPRSASFDGYRPTGGIRTLEDQARCAIAGCGYLCRLRVLGQWMALVRSRVDFDHVN